MEFKNDTNVLLPYFESLEHNIKLSKTTEHILSSFYEKFKQSDMLISKIDMVYEPCNEIIKPNDYSYIIPEIRAYIEKTIKYQIRYTFFLFGRIIKIYIGFTDENEISLCNQKAKMILIWLSIVTKLNTTKGCSKELNIFIFLTDLKKIIPCGGKITKFHVNTGFTVPCVHKSNIVIYRAEEWFKVFIHETIHNFALDFSIMDNHNTKQFILNIFPVKSDVKLFEAYTDTWAKIINCMFVSFYVLESKTRLQFAVGMNRLIAIERSFILFQVIKILEQMELTYHLLYCPKEFGKNIRKKYYENTSVLAYYVINSILLNDYQGFLTWCDKNNKNYVQFVHTKEKQILFCKFIKERYNDNKFLSRVAYLEKTFEKTKNKEKESYIVTNMRKSLFEILL